MGVQDDPYKEVFYGRDTGELIGTEAFSLDPFAGGSANGKIIYNVGEVNANLNRSGWDWYTNNYGVLDDGVLNFGFWNNIQELQNSYYVSDNGDFAFSEAFNTAAFSAFTDAQRAVARTTIALWDDLVSISFRETRSGVADITYGNTVAGQNVQAYAYLPFGDIFDDYYAQFGWEDAQIGRISGDVWIGGNVPSNFSPLANSYYSVITQIHETGHALGLSHPGDYNASDDDDGDGVPDPITYTNDAFYAQDSLQYTVMSYFDAYETGAQHIDWSLMNFAYAATPLVHDVSAIQAIYGVDTTSRTGNTVYGFNSTANRTAYDFTQNTRPIVTIWDAGGTDTLDFSGWNTPSVIDLNEGAFSSGGGVLNFPTLSEVNANRAALGFAPRSQATANFYEALKQQLGLTNGLFKDNISIAYGATIENATGGGGDDLLIANNVANVLTGNGGTDFVSYQAATAGVTASLATGGSAGYAAGDSYVGIEGLIGSASADALTGTDGNDLFGASGGADTIDGGTGSDTLTYQFAETGVSVSLGGAGLNGATLISVENLTGSAFDDTLGGNAAANVITGGDGVDTLYYAGAPGGVTINLATGGTGGWAAGDTYVGIENVSGNGFADNITGDDNNNVIQGGAGNDTLNGAGGIDTLSYADATAAVMVTLSNSYIIGGAGRDVVSGFENVTGSAFGDTVTGDGAANVLSGGGGNDSLNGAAGADTVYGGIGNDTLRGNNEGDLLFGDEGDDRLSGENGNDTLNGGTGNDELAGGANNDCFLFDTTDGIDTITDFRSGFDKIDVSAYGFTFIGSSAFSEAGQLRYFVDGGIKTLAGDIDGDGIADLVIRINGTSTGVLGTDLIL